MHNIKYEPFMGSTCGPRLYCLGGQIMKINGSISGGITNGHHPDSTEIQRLRRDLREEQERVQRLSAQLTTNVR